MPNSQKSGKNPKKIEHVFKLVGGKWTCLDMKPIMTLADYLTLQDVFIDEKTTFARLRLADNAEMWYRVIEGKITITIFENW